MFLPFLLFLSLLSLSLSLSVVVVAVVGVVVVLLLLLLSLSLSVYTAVAVVVAVLLFFNRFRLVKLIFHAFLPFLGVFHTNRQRVFSRQFNIGRVQITIHKGRFTLSISARQR